MGPYRRVICRQRTAMTVLSFAPSRHLCVPVRAFTEDAQPWEALASWALAASVVVITVLAARLYWVRCRRAARSS